MRTFLALGMSVSPMLMSQNRLLPCLTTDR